MELLSWKSLQCALKGLNCPLPRPRPLPTSAFDSDKLPLTPLLSAPRSSFEERSSPKPGVTERKFFPPSPRCDIPCAI